MKIIIYGSLQLCQIERLLNTANRLHILHADQPHDPLQLEIATIFAHFAMGEQYANRFAIVSN
jgi:hypothetical protein